MATATSFWLPNRYDCWARKLESGGRGQKRQEGRKALIEVDAGLLKGRFIHGFNYTGFRIYGLRFCPGKVDHIAEMTIYPKSLVLKSD